VSVTFKDDIPLDVINSKPTTAEDSRLSQSPGPHGGRVARNRIGSTISIDAVKLGSYRLIVIFGICLIVGLFSLPIIFYNVESSSEPINSNTCGISEVFIYVWEG